MLHRADGKVTTALLALAQKSNAKPGASWRVGVGTSVDEEPVQTNLADALSLRHALLHPKHAESKIQSAVMTVSEAQITLQP